MEKKWFFLFFILIFGFLTEAKKIPDPYKVLGIDRNANEDQIKAAFKRRSRKYHPDRNKKDPRAKQKFSQVVNAYELLKDPEKRRIYDQTGGEDPNEFQQQQGPGGFGGFRFPQGGGFGFPQGDFGFQQGGFGINIQEMMRGQFGGGFHQGQQKRHRKGRQDRQHRTYYSFSFGGNPGASYQF